MPEREIHQMRIVLEQKLSEIYTLKQITQFAYTGQLPMTIGNKDETSNDFPHQWNTVAKHIKNMKI